MSPEELQSVLESFFKKQYYAQLQKAAGEGKPLVVDFADLDRFNTDAADMLLESPYSAFQAIDAAISNIDVANIGDEPQRKITVRFRNLPKGRVVEVKNLRSRHIKKLIGVEGIIKQASEVSPQITAATFECKACGERITLLQEEQHLETPYACTCGNRRGFDLVSRKLIDHQRIVIEECPETLIGSAQPRKLAVFLRDDLVDPDLQKTVVPGSKVVVTGTLNDSPILTVLKQESVKRDIYMEANYLEPIEIEFEEIELSEKDIERVKELAKHPEVYTLLVQSIAPSIYGYDDVKEAIALQLFGGIRKVRKDGVITRGDIHVLLVGDPGCIAGDSQVALLYKGMEKIQSLGSRHLQPIREIVAKIRKNGKDKAYDFATVFQHYPKQPVLKVVTETGKSVICTYNQPFLTRGGWRRADKLSKGAEIRVMPKIPTQVKRLAPAEFVKVKKKSGHLKDCVSLPDKFTPELASLCGYIIGDGHIHTRGYSITCYINDAETDLIEKLAELWKKTFNIEPSVSVRGSTEKIKTISDKNGHIRQFISKQQMHIMEINSRQVAQSLSFLSAKRVPQAIFKSPPQVVAKFISWLFDADGCAFGNGRGRTSIQLKSRDRDLLSDVQLLLLYFGIQSRIIDENLCIRRSYDMELFAKHIGFNSEKKKAALKRVLESIKNKRDTQKRKAPQRYEKIVKILPAGIMNVYDFEVPKSHTFIANGIVCHNSGKSQLLKYTVGLAPKARYVVGKSASGAGLCVAPDSLILNNNGLREIKGFVEENFNENKAVEELPSAFSNEFCGKAFTLSEKLKLQESETYKIWRIKAPDKMIKITTQSGKELCLTANTSLIRIKQGKVEWVKAADLNEIDFVACARTLPEGSISYFPAIKLLVKNKNIRIKNDVSEKFTEITDALIKKYGSIQNIAKHIGVPRDRLYLWRTKGYYHGVPLHIFVTLGLEVGTPLDELVGYVKELFLRNGKNIKLPENIVDKDIAYLAGLMLGDGDTKLSKERVNMRLCGADFSILKRAKEILYEKFGINALEVDDGKRVPNIRFSHIPVYYILEAFGLCGKKEEITLSHLATEMPNEVLAGLLCGLYDTDGYVSKSESPSVGISTISENLAKNIQLSLLKFGIHSKLRERKVAGRISIGKTAFSRPIISRHDQFYVEISGKENLELFKEKIDFELERKSKALNDVLERIPKTNTNVDIIPEIGAELDRIISSEKGMTSKMWYLNKSNISRKKLKNILLNKNNKLLNTLADSDIFWEKITKREEFAPNYMFVYDFSVQEHHNFIANGFFVHNTATVVKDEFMRGWALEAGALVLANNGLVCIDELDKMSPDDRSSMHEAMEQQQVTISKANIQATLNARTTILAAANPKLGRFDSFKPLVGQIDLPETLLSRFDLIFAFRDIPNKERDTVLVRHILKLHRDPEKQNPPIDTELLRKYVSYAKNNSQPKLTAAAEEEIEKFYVGLRNKYAGEHQEGAAAVPIGARQLEAIVRLSEASARVRLGDKVTVEDAKRAIKVMMAYLMKLGVDPETGRLDIDRLESGISSTQRNKIRVIQDIIENMARDSEDGAVLIDDILAAAEEQGINDAMDIIQKMKREGELFEPKLGRLKKI